LKGTNIGNKKEIKPLRAFLFSYLENLKINTMNYSELKAEIEKMKEWIENSSDTDTVEIHCLNDAISAMEETLDYSIDSSLPK
tara:strand:+ start:1784 stop:2032 length:249 start_codon:yes stop_codon:yes gene_type:complete